MDATYPDGKICSVILSSLQTRYLTSFAFTVWEKSYYYLTDDDNVPLPVEKTKKKLLHRFDYLLSKSAWNGCTDYGYTIVNYK